MSGSFLALKENQEDNAVCNFVHWVQYICLNIITARPTDQTSRHQGPSTTGLLTWHALWTGALAYAVGGQMPQTQTNNPGLQHLIFGAFGLPFGLALILICGGEPCYALVLILMP